MPRAPGFLFLAPALVVSCFTSVVGCASAPPVSLLDHGLPTTLTPVRAIPLEVVTRSTAVDDPLPVRGSDVTYADLETALGASISSAAAPWAGAHKAHRPSGWQLSVELTQAEAVASDQRLMVTLTVRATLRTREDGTFLGQTQATCRESGLFPADRGAPVVIACMSRVGRDLAGWLSASDVDAL
jgi:hypothetical protein